MILSPSSINDCKSDIYSSENSGNKIEYLLLSIIIPFYNVEKYIAECLESVYQQDIPESDYEVILIDDNSTDGSKQIVENFQAKHPNLRLFKHAQRTLPATCRLEGISYTKGKFIWFIDADDFIKNNIFSKLLNIAESNNLEILHFNFQRIDENNEFSNEYLFYSKNTDVITGLEYFDNSDIDAVKMFGLLWNKIYSSDFLREVDISLPNVQFVEDYYQSYKSILNAKRFKFIDEKMYFWRKNPSSLTIDKRYTAERTAHTILACCATIQEFSAYRSYLFANEAITHNIQSISLLRNTYLYTFSFKEKMRYCKEMKQGKQYTKVLCEHLPFRKHLIFTFPRLIFIPLFVWQLDGYVKHFAKIFLKNKK